jgi:hypothetical protein
MKHMNNYLSTSYFVITAQINLETRLTDYWKMCSLWAELLILSPADLPADITSSNLDWIHGCELAVPANPC